MKCPREGCGYEAESGQGLKRHLTMSHGSWTLEDLKAAGVEPTKRDEARAVSGFASAEEVTAAAPGKEKENEDKQTRTRRSSKADEEAKAARAYEKIGVVLMRKAAVTPYEAWAALLSDPSMALSDEEKKELTDAYMQLAEAYGINFTSKWYALFAVVAVNGDCISKRLIYLAKKAEAQQHASSDSTTK